MRQKIFPLVLIVVLGVTVSARAQGGLPDLGIQKEKNLAVGVVESIEEGKIVLETKDGKLDVILIKQTGFKRLAPDKLSLKAAAESSLAEVSIGDRVLVTGRISVDKKSIVTKTVYLVKGSDLKAARDKERREWRTRGISGRVNVIDAVAKVITVEMRGLSGDVSTVKISPKEDAKFLRYSPNSVKYQDALASDFLEIKSGDMLRALGDRSEDQLSFSAEQILTGAFLTVSGTVKSVDIEKNEITITDLKSKKEVTIAINQDSIMKKFPEEIAQRLVRRQIMARMRAAGVKPPGSGDRTTGRERGSEGQQGKEGTKRDKRRSAGTGNPDGGQRRGGGERRRGGMRGDINDMIGRFPTISVADLKVGDMIAASSPKGNDPNRLTAIKLLAGVEPFLKAPATPNRRSRGSRGAGGGLTIPGLEGPSF